MSLINDALKRAKEAQQNNPAPAPDLQFRPAEPAPDRNVLPAVLGLLVLVVIVVLAGFFVWWTAQSHHAGQPAPNATVSAPEVAKANPTPQPEPEPKPAVAPPVAAPESNAPATTSSTPPLVTPAVEPVVTNTALAVTEAAPPKPAPPKLQGIIYSPNRASAVIDGKTVFVGDRVGIYKVESITRQSVTLTGGGQTIALSTEQ